MEPALITALVGGLTALGTGAWKLIDRADKKRERREAAVEELLRQRIATLEAEAAQKDADHKAELEKQATAFQKERRRTNRKLARIKAAAGKWREQLLTNDIQPDPAEWPTEDDNDDSE
ncbi:hypothetical protein RI444_15480 [Paenarthrobacter sp. AT5]|uniref:hypothetical protein n=1 Tax=Paenarthrobacter TaxID=1742992 RepID=UPI001A98C032|nr:MULTISPECIES: hypothetical protein [Paenarthrobacter]QSZ53266.1 hypothetical protein AYX19_09790 [Paenarthrobacter ureafaciens]WOC59909.1 hypothetical protein RI444_15480 [Paenarthrobacter sp. AT5]